MRSLYSSFLVCSIFLAFLLPVPSARASSDSASRISSGELPPPVIVAPAERAQLRGADHVTFRWDGVKGAAGYHLVLASDRQFKNIVSGDHHVTGTFYTVPGLNYGTYFLKISSVSADGVEGPFSERLSFIVLPPPPADALQ